MRALAGIALLLTAAAVFPQATRETDLLHGRPNSKVEFEIRPGVSVCAIYGRKGLVSRMAIRPRPRPGDAWRDAIPQVTIDSIVYEIIQPERRPMLTVKEWLLTSCRGEKLSSLKELTTVQTLDCSSDQVDVHLAILDFRPPLVGQLDDSVEMLPASEIAARAAILTADPSTWCSR